MHQDTLGASINKKLWRYEIKYMQDSKIFRKTLENGLNILVMPSHRTPQVSIQLWYHVGSKHERSGQKGIAHLIEHMIFKGTGILSESDINQITQKLGGYCNAFTSHDYTGYMFDFPSQNWHQALMIMADCMQNCTLRDDFLRSELKAVVQELKMYRDDYVMTALERMMGTIFPDHPYRYPIIGYKQDLWNLKRDELIAFYKEHYVPNNATLVIVGDVDTDDAMEQARKYFGAIPANPNHTQTSFYHASYLEKTERTLFCDIQQRQGIVVWEIPGICARKNFVTDLASWIVASGKGSRLYRRIVEELQLATEIDTFTNDLFEHGLFVVTFTPTAGVSSQKIADAICDEVEDIARNGFSAEELQRAERKAMVDWVSLREQNRKLAYLIGKFFTALSDEHYYINYREEVAQEKIGEEVQSLIATYLRSSVAHYAFVEPVPPADRNTWLDQQERSDAEDSKILSAIIRDVEVEQGVYVSNVHSLHPKPFKFPQPQRFALKNGLNVLYHHDPLLPTVDIIVDLKAKHYYDPEDKQGLAMFLADALQEGTVRRSAVEFANELEGKGMSLSVLPGLVSLKTLSSDLRDGLDIMADMLQNATLHQVVVERVRERLLSDVRIFWDTPNQCAAQLTRELVYQKHPYHRASLGTAQSLASITRDDLVQAKNEWITPQGATIALVGDLGSGNIEKLIEETLGAWEGPVVAELNFPPIGIQIPPQTIKRYLQRDQTVLALGRPSLSRKDPHYDALLLWDQIFTGGSSGSMNSRLFSLRERSGLFYTIGGSLLAGAAHQPGMAYISTMVSNDRLQEAEHQIRHLIDVGTQGLADEELDEARRSLYSAMIDAFATNRQVAGALLFLQEYNLPDDYFMHRSQQLASISRHQVEEAAKLVMNASTFATVLVGRV